MRNYLSFGKQRKEKSGFLPYIYARKWEIPNVRDLIAVAIEGGNQEIVRESIRLPIRISRLALQNDDHYLFQEFSWFPGLYYRYSQKEEIQSEIRSYLFDQSWKHFESLSKYYIETKLEKNIPDAKKLSLKDFAITILVTYQNLMKASYDNNDIEGFRRFQQTTLSLFTRTNRESKIYDIEHIESLLETPNISKERLSYFFARRILIIEKAIRKDKIAKLKPLQVYKTWEDSYDNDGNQTWKYMKKFSSLMPHIPIVVISIILIILSLMGVISPLDPCIHQFN